MILRIMQASVAGGGSAELVRRLRRTVVPRLAGADGVGTYAFGFRQADAAERFLALSTWRDFDAIVAAADGRPDQTLGSDVLGDLLQDISVDHFELIAPDLSDPPVIDGPVLGVLTAQVRPHAEPHVQAMIAAIRPRIAAAGVTALHIGRRMDSVGPSDLAVIAVWSDRGHLQAFADDRSEGLIDPAFTAELLEWTFTTYDCSRLMGGALTIGDRAGDGALRPSVAGSTCLGRPRSRSTARPASARAPCGMTPWSRRGAGPIGWSPGGPAPRNARWPSRC